MASKKELLLKLRHKKVKQKVAIITNIRVVTQHILEIMQKHIGEAYAISKLNLFRKVFNTNPEEVSELQEWFMWEMIKRAMHNCRRNTKCFIVSKRIPVSIHSAKGQGIYHFWVASTLSDVKVYVDNLERNIRAMRNMEKKCARSVQKRWYNQNWEYKG